ncbi:MAG: ParA family partition ATPase [Rickettsiaceae bacterium]
MLKVITVAQQKGGAGKTTIAAHLAVSLSQTGKRVSIIDIDPQGSLTNWHSLREKRFGLGYTGLNFASSAGWRVESAINNLRNDFDYVIIDAPPHTETESKSAIRASNLIVVPMQPSPTDLWATGATIEFAQSENIPAKILLNRFNPQSKITKEILAKVKGDRFKCSLGNRVAFSSCFLNGMTVTESAPSSQAATEIKDFTQEVLKIFGPVEAPKVNNKGAGTKRAMVKA